MQVSFKNEKSFSEGAKARPVDQNFSRSSYHVINLDY